jgi:20S proteasome alpha/beta subunit
MKVARAGVRREKGYLYYIDKNGNIARVKMARGGAKGQKSKP